MESITLGEVSLYVGFIVALWKGIDFLKEKANAPQKKMQEQMDLMLKITFSLLEHQVTGNHVNDMNKLYTEVKDYLIKN